MYDEYDVGHLLCPRSRNLVWSREWAADNAAFSRFDADAYRSMLARIHGRLGCLFVTAPDVVGDATATLACWAVWEPVLRSHALPAAFVLQDGITPAGVPWETCAAVFIGGTTAFKLGPEARACVAEAKRRSKWVHMGRVNSERRLRYAQSIGVDSVDGSGFARFPDAMFPLFARVSRIAPLFVGATA